jgi:hypothetical protein
VYLKTSSVVPSLTTHREVPIQARYIAAPPGDAIEFLLRTQP